MVSRFARPFLTRASSMGIIYGVLYGIIARLMTSFHWEWLLSAFVVMSFGFLFVVPITVGILTVRDVEAPSMAYRALAPWIPMMLTIGFALLIGWEGVICSVLAIPLVLPLSSVGGLLTKSHTVGTRGVPIALFLPYLISPIEQRLPTPRRLVETVTEIQIDAPPSVVWPLVASVDSIRPDERRWALFVAMGFPRPVSATLSHPGVGGIRTAQFEHGLVFTETVTDWEPEHRLSFTIKPNTASIPPTTLDPHVTIGGPFFDVLTGTYELYPSNDGRGTRLVLRSVHRVSTRFNTYAGWWAEHIMGSIQRNILVVHKGRAERIAHHGSAQPAA